MDDEKKKSDDGLTRRDMLVKGAIAVGAAAAGMYVPPKLTSLGSPFKVRGDDRGVIPSAHAKSAPANKENCDKDPTSDKDPNEDCDKCANDKDPTEKDGEGPPKDANYDKCLQDKPCDKPPADKDPLEGNVPQMEPKQFAGQVKDEWG
jgi:hypothetical protein